MEENVCKIKCVVACTCVGGNPDLVPVMVVHQIEPGAGASADLSRETARDFAFDRQHVEPMVAFCGVDLPDWMAAACNWETVPEVPALTD